MPRRWSSTYRIAEDNFGIVADFVKSKIDDAIKVSQAGPARSPGDPSISVIEKLILRNGPDSAITYVTAFDMVLAGIDTTGNTFAFLVYIFSNMTSTYSYLQILFNTLLCMVIVLIRKYAHIC